MIGYIITFIVGGMFGVAVMCLMFVSKEGDKDGK